MSSHTHIKYTVGTICPANIFAKFSLEGRVEIERGGRERWGRYREREVGGGEEGSGGWGRGGRGGYRSFLSNFVSRLTFY